jgi:hypothetical protein
MGADCERVLLGGDLLLLPQTWRVIPTRLALKMCSLTKVSKERCLFRSSAPSPECKIVTLCKLDGVDIRVLYFLGDNLHGLPRWF